MLNRFLDLFTFAPGVRAKPMLIMGKPLRAPATASTGDMKFLAPTSRSTQSPNLSSTRSPFVSPTNSVATFGFFARISQFFDQPNHLGTLLLPRYDGITKTSRTMGK